MYCIHKQGRAEISCRYLREHLRRRFYLGCWENDPKRKICLAKIEKWLTFIDRVKRGKVFSPIAVFPIVHQSLREDIGLIPKSPLKVCIEKRSIKLLRLYKSLDLLDKKEINDLLETNEFWAWIYDCIEVMNICCPWMKS